MNSNATFILQNIINALQWGSFYALIALGYSMVYGILMLFNFAHGDVFMVGAYIGLGIATVLLAVFAGSIMPGWLILILTIIITMFLTSLVGIGIERIGYRPLRHAPRASTAVTGLMIGIMLQMIILILLGPQQFQFPFFIETTTYNIGGVFITNTKIIIVGVSLTLMTALHLFIKKTKYGMAMRAMSFDFLAVPLMGVSINVIAPLTFAIGSGLAASAGILYGMAYPVLNPLIGATLGWKAFVAAILGGRGSVMGAAMAGFLLGFLEIFSAAIFPSTYRDLITYSIVIIILTFRPHGFFGQAHSSQLRL